MYTFVDSASTLMVDVLRIKVVHIHVSSLYKFVFAVNDNVKKDFIVPSHTV